MLPVKINTLCTFLIALLLAGTLVNINTFGPPTLAAYFFYTITASFLGCLSIISYLIAKKAIIFPNPLPLCLIGLFAAYCWLSGLANANNDPISIGQYYMPVNTLLLLAFVLLLIMGHINHTSVCFCIMVVAGFECLVCFLQQISILGSANEFFTVTGTYVNPNVTAMFMAMSIPAIAYLFYNGKRKLHRTVTMFVFVSTCISLALLNCRTAFIGSAVATIIILNYQYSLWHKLNQKSSKVVVACFVTCFIVVIILAGSWIYHYKQDSSDGRAFTWKICLGMIADKPITGYGYGRFTYAYNLAQAAYFAKGLGTAQEIMNADYVHICYNDFLEKIVDGGISGLLIYVSFIVSILLIKPSTDKTNKPSRDVFPFAYAAIVSFLVMGIFNFTSQSTPVFCLFLWYVASVMVNGKPSLLGLLLPVKTRLSLFWGTGFAFSLFLFVHFLNSAKAYAQCKSIKNDLINNVNTKNAALKLAALQPILGGSVFYWNTYADAFLVNKRYLEGLDKLKHAAIYSCAPELNITLGKTYVLTNQYAAAENIFILASNIQPHHYLPRYALMKMYARMNDVDNTIKMAREIMTMETKVASDKVDEFKNDAQAIIQLCINQKLGK